jgi:mRNA interferase RelE/StbE
MAYTVTFKASALKQTQNLQRGTAQRILAKAAVLAEDPRPPGCVKLMGSGNLWRLRVGDYRLVYAIDDARKLVDIRIVVHRREVYRDV